MKGNLLKLTTKRVSEKTIRTHIIFWILFIVYELTFIYFTIGKIERLYVYLIYYSINIGFFYLYIETLNYVFVGHKFRYFQGILGYLMLLAVYFLAKLLSEYFLESLTLNNINSFAYIRDFLPRNILRAFYFTILGTFFWSAGHISHFRRQAQEAEKLHLIAQKEKAELEIQLTKSRNAYLQQQIKPHLLFNTLNFVYSNAQKYSDDAAHVIWLLAEIMRFSLEEPDYDGKINLVREIEQIENMLELNRYRFEYPLYICAEMQGNFSNFQIIPLILLTLTENIFKHGDLTEATQPAVLNITLDDTGKMVFFSRNLKKSKNKHPRSQQALGLENVRIRLDATYSGHYKLDITEPNEFYELTLTLNL